jgi:hypothetical protein
MKPIPIPRRLQDRPLWRGLPIPYITMIRDDGTPDFRVTDEHNRRAVIENDWCQLCGDALGRWVFFTGGTEAAKANAYFEPAAHLDCLIYAMRVCPFIVGRIEHADLAKIQEHYDVPVGRASTKDGHSIVVKADDTFASVRNPLWVIKKATRWSYGRTGDGTILLRPHVVKESPPFMPEEMASHDWEQLARELAR